MTDTRTLEAIESSDTDELLRIVDGHCKSRDWEALEDLRQRCREAVGRGKQLWGVDELVRYRFALEGPPARVGKVLAEGRTRFTLGPLPEVAASTNTWAELVDHLGNGPERKTVAAERTVRGETVEEVFELPELQSWEPEYAVATYTPNTIETPVPKLPDLHARDLPGDYVTIDDLDSEAALGDLVDPWVTQSSGRCQTASVEGDASTAIAALGLRRVLVAALRPQQALAQMAWAAASGGAHGDRRGAAAGRYLAWWVVATLADLDWPATSDVVGQAAERMEWLWFDDNSPPGGWALRLAAADPATGLGWAISASDMSD